MLKSKEIKRDSISALDICYVEKKRPLLQNYNDAVPFEWLETNGLGGWSSSTIIGCNTRRYHGILVASIVPPTERMVLVSKFDETIIDADKRYELGTNDYGQVIHPEGYQYQTIFSKGIFPEFTYEAGSDIKVKKTIAMIQGENTVVIIYDVIKALNPFILELLPLLAVRGYHNLTHSNESINQESTYENHIFSTKAYNGTPDIFIKVPVGDYRHQPCWYYNFNYAIERCRGLDFAEDLFTPGIFQMELKNGDSLGIVISIENPENKDAHSLLDQERLRRESLIPNQRGKETIERLSLAADQFIVKKGENSKTVIAGYYWFTDWGRDTMISLPGLTLATKRFDDAKKIISSFAQSISMGMLPNRFPDNGLPPEYNNVDGTLWYFIAVYRYWRVTKDKRFVLEEILPTLKDIIDWHFKGTRFNIHVTEDGLLFAGEPGQQLTWMDAKIGSRVVTPRMGKPVEVQALWYNALKIFEELLNSNSQPSEAEIIRVKAEKTKEVFLSYFWNAKGNYLYDVIDENGHPNPEIRPNQLFAISLPFPLIDGEWAKAVLQIVGDQLYTPVGLRSLSKYDYRYVPTYCGNASERDSAYHQGTVWSWLLGPYVDSIMKVIDSKTKAQEVIDNFKYHLNEGCLGSVSEIFDAEPPYHPKGCVAQAWGVAEILRVITEYGLC